MQLSKRLNAVASLVTPGNRVADIGCDHAYISIYLAKQGISPKIIAMDINQGPIDRAMENIIRFGQKDKIDIRKSNGLEKLYLGEADTVLIAGMGGGLMVQILSEKLEIVKTLQELILQPQSEINRVRKMLEENGFLIINENMLMEDGKYYVMMKAVPESDVLDKQAYMLTKEEHLYYGRLLLEQKNAVLLEFLLWDLSLCRNIMQNLEMEQTENALLRQKEITEKMELIHCGLEYYKEER